MVCSVNRWVKLSGRDSPSLLGKKFIGITSSLLPSRVSCSRQSIAYLHPSTIMCGALQDRAKKSRSTLLSTKVEFVSISSRLLVTSWKLTCRLTGQSSRFPARGAPCSFNPLSAFLRHFLYTLWRHSNRDIRSPPYLVWN